MIHTVSESASVNTPSLLEAFITHVLSSSPCFVHISVEQVGNQHLWLRPLALYHIKSQIDGRAVTTVAGALRCLINGASQNFVAQNRI
jgi:hypothetical protein